MNKPKDIDGYIKSFPEDIQEITVLKDAAASAVWGSNGANGVIEITTKKGYTGPTKIEYTYRYTATVQPA